MRSRTKDHGRVAAASAALLLAATLLAPPGLESALAQDEGCSDVFNTARGSFDISLRLLDERRIDRAPYDDDVILRLGTVVDVLGENGCRISWEDAPELALTCGSRDGRNFCSGSLGGLRYETDLAPSLECEDLLRPWANWLIEEAGIADACGSAP